MGHLPILLEMHYVMQPSEHCQNRPNDFERVITIETLKDWVDNF